MKRFCFLILFSIAKMLLAEELTKESLVDPLSFSKEYLSECILEELNGRRQVKINSNPSLNKVSTDFQLVFEAKHFYAASRYQARIDKDLSIKNSDQLDYEGSLVLSAVSSIDMIDYKGGDFHYHRADKLSTLHLYYGERSKYNQTEDKLIPMHTYGTLAKKIIDESISGENKKLFKSEAYKDIGLSLALDYKTLYRSKIPQLKVIFIFGGNQTALLKDMTN